MPLIKNGEIVQDSWIEATADAPLPEVDALLVPYAIWKEHREALMQRNGRLGVRLAADQPPQLIAGDLDRLDLVALEFPTFRDGRAYSYARLLRERYGYRKELRAVGNVLRDQFLFMHRCGFDAYEIAHPDAAQVWRKAIGEFTVFYQRATDDSVPATLLRQRRQAAE
jgi:uncharacterized protein (DUF934 family)